MPVPTVAPPTTTPATPESAPSPQSSAPSSGSSGLSLPTIIGIAVGAVAVAAFVAIVGSCFCCWANKEKEEAKAAAKANAAALSKKGSAKGSKKEAAAKKTSFFSNPFAPSAKGECKASNSQP